jgi:uncharacterized protein
VTFFFVSFFFLYTTLHCYAFIKLRQALQVRGLYSMALVLFMAVMVLAPALIRFLERADHEAWAQVFAYVGYTWMACIFLFFMISICFDLIRFLAYLLAKAFDVGTSWDAMAGRLLTMAAAACAMLIVGYGWYEANTICTERVVIRSPRIQASVGTLRIAQISDLHLGLTVGEAKLRRVLEAVKKLDPDVLVVTGDIIDVQAQRLDGMSELFRAIEPRWGKYAVTGNHEYYAGIESAIEFTGKSGIRLLRGESVTIGGFLSLTGIDDYVVQAYEPKRVNRWETQLLQNAPSTAFRVLLKHRPIVYPDAVGIMELQLSGHTHKGQIFPFTLATQAAYKTYAGLYNLGKGSLLYVNRGTGTWGPPVRFLAPPEVTLFEIVHAPL